MTQAAIIAKTQGSVLVTREGQDIPLTQGDALFESDTIKTADASVEITFADGSRATLGPQTVMSIKDFAFSAEEAPSFVVDLAMGAMRTISGKIVESNPDAFKLITPHATVGIRGTDFISTVDNAGVARFILNAIDQGHNLVVTSHTGNQISLSSAGQAVSVQLGGELVPQTFSVEDMEQVLLRLANGTLDVLGDSAPAGDLEKELGDDEEIGDELGQGETDAEERSSSGEESTPDEDSTPEDEARTGTDATHLLREQELQDDTNTNLAQGATAGEDGDGQSSDIPLLATPPEQDEVTENDDTDDDLHPYTPDSGHSSGGYVHVEIDGTTSYFADEMDHSSSSSSPHPPSGSSPESDGHAIAHHITVTEDMSTPGVMISGDVSSVSPDMYTIGAGDIIVAKNMADGTLVGDAGYVGGGTLMGGADNITVENKTGGLSIYGDAATVDSGAVSFGNDSITVKGDFVNSTIGGDAQFVNSHVIVELWGSDHITIHGNMGDDIQSTELYGDASGGEGHSGGHDTINVHGMMSFNSNIFGGAGNDAITVNEVHGGGIYGDTTQFGVYGDDKVTINTMRFGSVYTNEGADSIHIKTGAETSGQAYVDVGSDAAADSIFLAQGGGHLTIRHMNTAHDKLHINGTERGVFGDGQYGDYHLIFEGLTGNRVPYISSPTGTLSLVKDTETSKADSVHATDADGDTLSYSVKSGAAAQYGTVTLVGDSYTYVLDANNPAVQGLFSGQSLSDSFTILVDDGQGGTAEKVVSVTIAGSGSPTPPPVSQNIVYSELQYDALAEGFIIQEHDGSNAVFGNTSITIDTDADKEIGIIGDSHNVASGTGGVDTILVTRTMSASTILGDALNATGTFVSAGDYITINGSMSGEASILGDAAYASDSVHISGSDEITINGDISGDTYIAGDVTIANDSVHISGSDEITINGDISGDTYIVGDVTIANGSVTISGSDRITIKGNLSDLVQIEGDGNNIHGSATASSHDFILIEGDMRGDTTIVGDMYSTLGDASTMGNDEITVYGNMGSHANSDGSIGEAKIYGDADSVSGNATSTGHDKITINGNIDGEAMISGDVFSVSNDAKVTGDDIITVNGDMMNGRIYGDAFTVENNATATGNDQITIKGDFAGGNIYAGNGADTITINNADGRSGTIDVGVDTDGDKIYLNNAGGGHFTLDNFNTTHDKLYLNGVVQTVTGSGSTQGTFGGYTVTFKNLISGGISQNITYTEVQYDELANAASPNAATIQEHDGSNDVFGNTSITILDTNHDRDVNIVGDTTTVTSGTGGSDTILVKGAATDGMIMGDAVTLSGTFAGGNDDITVTGIVGAGVSVSGDAMNAAGTSTTVSWSGSDKITIEGGMGGASVYGDASAANAGYSAGSDEITLTNNMTGGFIDGDIAYMSGSVTSSGHDVIRLTNSMSGSSTKIFGDALDIANDAVSRGNDNIQIDGSVENSSIYGDTLTLRDDAVSEGHDNIRTGAVINGTIYGDAETMEGAAKSVGNDNILVSGDFEGDFAVIYGDAKTMYGTTSTQGDDNIAITGNMKAGTTIYGDISVFSSSGQTVGRDNIAIGGNVEGGQIWLDSGGAGNAQGVNDDKLTINGSMSGGTIYARAGTDMINIGTESGGTDTVEVSLTGADNLTLLFNAGSDASSTSGDTYNFVGIFSNTVATVHLLGANIATLSNMNINYNGVSIVSDLQTSGSYTNGNVTFLMPTVHMSVTGGKIEGDAGATTQFNDSSIVLAADLTNDDAIYGDAESGITGGTGGDDVIVVTGSVGNTAISTPAGIVFGDTSTLNSTSGAFVCGNDSIVVNNGLVSGAIFGDAQYVRDAASAGGHDIISVNNGMTGGNLYGDAAEVTGTGNITGNDSITINGNMSSGGIFGDAQTVSTTGTQGGDDIILVNGIMSGGSIDAGAGNDSISVGIAGTGATGGTITGGAGNDAITLFVGDTGSRGNLIIDANGMHFTDESIALHDAGTGETHVSITNLSNTQDYGAGSFTVDGTDITSHVNTALDTNQDSYTHGDLIIYFK